MNHRVVIRPGAEADITDAALWYQNQRSGMGDEFVAEVHSTIERALANPRAYKCLRRRPDVRRVLTRRFPYRIFFVLRSDAVVVFRVLHSARHDREWKGKIPEE